MVGNKRIVDLGKLGLGENRMSRGRGAGCAAAAAKQRGGDGRAVPAHRPAARFRGSLQRLLDQAGLAERLVTAPNLDDPAENQAREQLLAQHRGYGTRTGLVNGFPHDVCWQWMAITPAELAMVRYAGYDYWAGLSGGTRLAADAAPRIRAGVAPFGVSSDWALGMAQAVADRARFPPLILVTAGPSGGLVVLEGHVRLTAYLLRPCRRSWRCWPARRRAWLALWQAARHHDGAGIKVQAGSGGP